MADRPVEWFQPSSGRVSAVLGLLAVAALVAYAVAYPGMVPWPVLATTPLAAVLIWLTLLRPRVGLSEEHLVLRGALQTVRLPLAAVHDVAVRRMLVVFAGDQRHLNASLSRSALQLRRLDKRGGSDRIETGADLAEARIREQAAEARRRAGVGEQSPEQAALAAGVRREWGWPPVVALAGSVLLLALSWGWTLAR